MKVTDPESLRISSLKTVIQSNLPDKTREAAERALARLNKSRAAVRSSEKNGKVNKTRNRVTARLNTARTAKLRAERIDLAWAFCFICRHIYPPRARDGSWRLDVGNVANDVDSVNRTWLTNEIRKDGDGEFGKYFDMDSKCSNIDDIIPHASVRPTGAILSHESGSRFCALLLLPMHYVFAYNQGARSKEISVVVSRNSCQILKQIKMIVGDTPSVTLCLKRRHNQK